MKNEKEQWINDVFESVKGSERAKPNTDLFTKIESQIDSEEAKIIPMRQWRMAVAAAVVILIMNVFAIQNFTQNNRMNADEIENETNQPLISNFNLYDL